MKSPHLGLGQVNLLKCPTRSARDGHFHHQSADKEPERDNSGPYRRPPIEPDSTIQVVDCANRIPQMIQSADHECALEAHRGGASSPSKRSGCEDGRWRARPDSLKGPNMPDDENTAGIRHRQQWHGRHSVGSRTTSEPQARSSAGPPRSAACHRLDEGASRRGGVKHRMPRGYRGL
jgi:hypothetical protein